MLGCQVAVPRPKLGIGHTGRDARDVQVFTLEKGEDASGLGSTLGTDQRMPEPVQLIDSAAGLVLADGPQALQLFSCLLGAARTQRFVDRKGRAGCRCVAR